jgi:hypothetical protein
MLAMTDLCGGLPIACVVAVSRYLVAATEAVEKAFRDAGAMDIVKR